MKIIISESQNVRILRRIPKIQRLVKDAIKILDTEAFGSPYDYIDEVCWQVRDEFREFYLEPELLDEIMQYVKEKYSPFLKQYYIEMSS